jgi:hypothetical protein
MTLYQRLKEDRPKIFTVHPDNAKGALDWWLKHGREELVGRLFEIGRKEVFQATQAGDITLEDWYIKHAGAEYGNIWENTERIDRAKLVPLPPKQDANLISEDLGQAASTEVATAPADPTELKTLRGAVIYGMSSLYLAEKLATWYLTGEISDVALTALLAVAINLLTALVSDIRKMVINR